MTRFFIWLLFILILSSCSNDLDLLDQYKETMVVYGLLDQADTAQYIKIYKAYLGPGNALQMAQNYDSINYANQLDVEIERWYNGNKMESFVLNQNTGIPKDSGTFVYPDQVCYRTNAVLDDASEYHLVITNTSTGKVARATTGLVKNLSISLPTSGGAFSVSNPKGKQKVDWLSSAHGKLYQVTIRFHYDEAEPGGFLVSKYVDWVFAAQRSLTSQGGESMNITFLNEDFYKFLRGSIAVNTTVLRYAKHKKIEFRFAVAAEDFATYMDVYKPSNGIVQEKPDYTNIDNGLGLFSSRFNTVIYKDSLTKLSMDSLISGEYTSELGFQ